MAHGHHLIPKKVYWIVFSALIFLTILTYLTAEYLDLGPLNVPLAIAIALFKCSLVVLFFMALKYDTRVNAMVFLLGGVFVLVFIGVTLLDTTFRGFMDEDKGITLQDLERETLELVARDSVAKELLNAQIANPTPVAIPDTTTTIGNEP